MLDWCGPSIGGPPFIPPQRSPDGSLQWTLEVVPRESVYFVRSVVDAEVLMRTASGPDVRWQVHAGVCMQWNLWALPVGVAGILLMPHSVAREPQPPALPLLLEDKFFFDGGAATLYDFIDPSSPSWSVGRRLWRDILEEGGGDDSVLDDFAAYVRATWLLSLSDAELARMPRSVAQRFVQALPAAGAWSDRAFALFASVAELPEAGARFNLSLPWLRRARRRRGDTLPRGGGVSITRLGRPVFEDSLMGHYLFHEASFPPMA